MVLWVRCGRFGLKTVVGHSQKSDLESSDSVWITIKEIDEVFQTSGGW